MKTLTFIKEGTLFWGVKGDQGIMDVEAAKAKFPEIEGVPQSVKELMAFGQKGLNALEQLMATACSERDLFFDEETLEFGPSVPHPQKILCVGLNYRRHADETGMEHPTTPILFSKFSNALSGHRALVRLPESGREHDYEAELAVVIGKECRDASEEEALEFVYGYTGANDMSIRDLQFRTTQWLLGKTSDGFCPLGPYLVSKDEIGDPNSLKIKLTLNGEVRQESNTSDMIFSCREIVSYISKHMTLMPGDIILTGTPEGVIMGESQESRTWLKDGDEMTVEIEQIGRLTTTVFKSEAMGNGEPIKNNRITWLPAGG